MIEKECRKCKFMKPCGRGSSMCKGCRRRYKSGDVNRDREIEALEIKLKEKGWKINQPFKEYPEVMIVENKLEPGELGRALEHLLGYYYVQELASMLPIIALNVAIFEGLSTTSSFFFAIKNSP